MSNHWYKPNLGNKPATTIVPPCQDHTRSIPRASPSAHQSSMDERLLLLMESRQAHCSRVTLTLRPSRRARAQQLAGDLRRNDRTGSRDLDLSDEGRHGAVPPTGTDRASRPAGAHSSTRPRRISSAGRVAELGPVPYHPAARPCTFSSAHASRR